MHDKLVSLFQAGSKLPWVLEDPTAPVIEVRQGIIVANYLGLAMLAKYGEKRAFELVKAITEESRNYPHAAGPVMTQVFTDLGIICPAVKELAFITVQKSADKSADTA